MTDQAVDTAQLFHWFCLEHHRDILADDEYGEQVAGSQYVRV